GENNLVLRSSKRHGLQIQTWTGEKLSSCFDTSPSHLRIEHRACAYQKIASLLDQRANHLHSSGDGHGDLDDRNSSSSNRFRGTESIVAGSRANHGDDPHVDNSLEDFGLIHRFSRSDQSDLIARYARQHPPSLAVVPSK